MLGDAVNVSVGNRQADTSSFTGSWGELSENQRGSFAATLGLVPPSLLPPPPPPSSPTEAKEELGFAVHAGLYSFQTEDEPQRWELRAALGLCDFLTPSLSSSFPSTGLCGPITPPFSLERPQCLALCLLCECFRCAERTEHEYIPTKEDAGHTWRCLQSHMWSLGGSLASFLMAKDAGVGGV